VLARQADLSRDDAEWFAIVATETAGRLVLEEEDGLAIEQAALAALHPAIGRRVVLAALRRVSGGRFVGAEHVEAVLALGAAAGSGGIDLPGQRVTVGQGRVRFEARAADPGRGGQRRGRPEPIRGAAVSKPVGSPSRIDAAGHVVGGPQCAESVSLEGHAPKGGRG
jgi:hypothetical protein